MDPKVPRGPRKIQTKAHVSLTFGRETCSYGERLSCLCFSKVVWRAPDWPVSKPDGERSANGIDKGGGAGRHG